MLHSAANIDFLVAAIWRKPEGTVPYGPYAA